MSSLILIKPDAIRHKLLGHCISCFETFGIDDIRLVQMDEDLCAQHYADHIDKEFYPGLQAFMCSGRVCALSVAGDVDAVRDVAMDIRRHWMQYVSGPCNLVHASDSVEAARRELTLWFNLPLSKDHQDV